MNAKGGGATTPPPVSRYSSSSQASAISRASCSFGVGSKRWPRIASKSSDRARGLELTGGRRPKVAGEGSGPTLEGPVEGPRHFEPCPASDLADRRRRGIDAHLDDVATGYESFLAQTAAEGDPSVNARQLLVQLKRSIDNNRVALDGLDGAVVDKVHVSENVSSELKTLAGALILKLRFVRDTCRNMFGKTALKRTALAKRLPQRPLRVFERARLVQSSLLSPEFSLLPIIDLSTADEEGAWTPAKLAGSLEPELSQLDEMLDKGYVGKRENTGARSLRRDGITEFDRNMRGIVRIVQGMFQLSGQHKLSERFTTALRRFTRRSPEPSLPPPPPPESESVQDSTQAS